MPSYLSDGNRHFQQTHRINPSDPISKLGYYLDTSPSPSSSANSNWPASRRLSGRFGSARIQKSSSPSSASSSSASTSYSSRLLNLLHNRQKNPNGNEDSDYSYDKLLKKRFLLDRERNKKNATETTTAKNTSPLETSGFSEGTLVEPITRHDFSKNQHSNLKDRNFVSFTLHGTANTSPNQINLKSNDDDSDQFSSDANIRRILPTSSKQRIATVNNLPRGKLRPVANNFDRLKRRKINRNKRMVVIGEDQNSYMFSNPYALSELFSQSEIPGFREIFASDSYLRKFCWIVAFLFMTVLSLNDMTELITEYYDYPITVDVRLRDSARLPFPAVTVCNLNAVRFSSLCSNSRHDLTKQIPSELRDKLCGIQVEKNKNKNANHTDSNDDIGDINNIGMTTTTTTTPSTTTVVATTLASNLTTDNSTATMSEASPSKNKNSSLTDEQHKQQKPSKDELPFEHKLQHPQSDLLQSIRRSKTGHKTGRSSQPLSGGRLRRSIQMNDQDEPVRPFASHRSRIRVKQQAQDIHQSPVIKQTSSGDKQSVQYQNRVQSAHQSVRPNYWPPAVPPLASAPAVSPGQPFNVPIRGQQPTQGPPGPPQGGGGNNFPSNAAQPGANNNNNNNNREQNQTSPFTFNPISSLPDDFELSERQERELQENLTNWLAVMYQRDAQLTRSLGHQFDDMILRCTMKSVNCTRQRSFENSFSPTEGNCFTYRSRSKRKLASASLSPSQQRQQNALPSSGWEESNLAGTNDGLELVLNLEKNEYISGSSQVGALVMIHHPNDLGYAASEATFIAPEFTTYIGLKMVNITRLPAPYPESCVDSWPAKFADYLTRNSTYSQQACLKICLQMTIQSKCQCQSAILPIVEAPASGSQNSSNPKSSSQSGEQQPQQQNRVIICDTRKQATRLCVREVNFRTPDRVHSCDCPPKCQVVRYDKTISMARWPTREDKVSFDRGKTDVSFQNLAKVIVYFQTMTCEEVSQQAVFNAAKLFSALGGIMGMYVGFSFLSVFEIVEVISRKFWHYLTNRLCQTRLINNYHA